MFLLGRHSLMARPQDTVSVFGRDFPLFLVTLPLFFFQLHHFLKEVTREDREKSTPLGHHWGTARALLSNLQLVSWRDYIGDVVL